MPLFKVLVVAEDGNIHANAETVELMERAGFEVHLISSLRYPKKYQGLHQFIYVKVKEDIPAKILQISPNYKLIIIVGDQGLYLIKNSELSDLEKTRILPITKKSSLKHLCSKIELSKLFLKHHILTPPFICIKSREHAYEVASQLGFPSLLKIDFSGGGFGVFKLNKKSDLRKVPDHFFEHPLLLQKFIEGRLLDISGFFLDNKLIHFTCSEFLDAQFGAFGPSRLRNYFGYGLISPCISKELSKIGQVLGAHGFTNISCIETKDQRRYYFEADIRPNVWINYPRDIGYDLATEIKKYTLTGLHFNHQRHAGPYFTSQQTYIMPYPPRFHWFQILSNRHHSLRYLKLGNIWMNGMAHIMYYPYNLKCKLWLVKYIKPYMPSELWHVCKKLIEGK